MYGAEGQMGEGDMSVVAEQLTPASTSVENAKIAVTPQPLENVVPADIHASMETTREINENVQAMRVDQRHEADRQNESDAKARAGIDAIREQIKNGQLG